MKTSKDFDSVYRNGAKWHTASLVIFFRPSLDSKIGLTVSKKIGNAVKRNLTKRRLRALYRMYSLDLVSGWVVIVAKSGIEEMAFKQLEQEFFYALKRVGAVKQRGAHG